MSLTFNFQFFLYHPFLNKTITKNFHTILFNIIIVIFFHLHEVLHVISNIFQVYTKVPNSSLTNIFQLQ